MERAAFFGRPRDNYQSGGGHIAIYLVPVFEGNLIAFDVHAPGAEDRWLPWGIATYDGSPYVDASTLVDDWCQGAMSDLRLVDIATTTVMGSWELGLIFRSELTAMPAGDSRRTPVALEPPFEAGVRQFAPVELERWLAMGAAPRPAAPAQRTEPGPKLLF